jgi:hypothetical protein
MQKKLAKPYNTKPTAFRLTAKAVQKIAAVEGIDLTGDVAKEFAEFDRLGLTSEQRIAAIKAKFGKPSA